MEPLSSPSRPGADVQWNEDDGTAAGFDDVRPGRCLAVALRDGRAMDPVQQRIAAVGLAAEDRVVDGEESLLASRARARRARHRLRFARRRWARRAGSMISTPPPSTYFRRASISPGCSAGTSVPVRSAKAVMSQDQLAQVDRRHLYADAGLPLHPTAESRPPHRFGVPVARVPPRPADRVHGTLRRQRNDAR